MPYNTNLADSIRTYFRAFPKLKIEEKKMFSGLAFMINGKMCVNVSGENMMCRFDPERQPEVAVKKGYQPVIMKGKALDGYCYVSQAGFNTRKDFEYWVNLCLSFNEKAVSSKRSKKK
jgi:hypothetical protein